MPKNLGLIILGILMLVVSSYFLLADFFSEQFKKIDHVEFSTQAIPLSHSGRSIEKGHSIPKNDQESNSLSQDRQNKNFPKTPRPFTQKHNDVAGDLDDDETVDWRLPPGMTQEDIPIEYRNNLERFYERLEEIKENEIEVDEIEAADPISFSTLGPDMNLGLPYLMTSLSPYSKRIFATFDCTTDNMRDIGDVLVKWYDSNKDVYLYEYFHITADATYNYVWKEMDYWDLGNYHVDIFKLEENIKLLASGSFTVDRLDTYVSYLGTYPAPETEFSESNFYNDDEIYLIFNHSNETDRYLQLTIYNIENRATILNDDVLLPVSQNALFRLKIKESRDALSLGSYGVLLLDNENLVGRSKFYINE